jgi:hypothetical protein
MLFETSLRGCVDTSPILTWVIYPMRQARSTGQLPNHIYRIFRTNTSPIRTWIIYPMRKHGLQDSHPIICIGYFVQIDLPDTITLAH